jgi:hypothetical protein
MESGAVADDGPTSQVLQSYMARERAKLEGERHRDVQFASVRVRKADGAAVTFAAGEKVWIDLKFKAHKEAAKIAVVLDVLDESLSEVFNTSSERLGHAPIDLKTGQECSITFELDLHLANGTFHVGAYLYRYDVQRELDRVLPAATFFVASNVDVRGHANLYPKVVSTEVSQQVAGCSPI